MAKDNRNVEVTKESLNDNTTAGTALDMNAIEMIFGTPASPKTGQNDVHMITNEKKNGKDPYSNHNNHRDVETPPSQPLLEPDRERQKPPLAGPEVDDLDYVDDARPTDATPYPGIDDGLLDPDDKKHGDGENADDEEQHKTDDGGDHLVPLDGHAHDADDANFVDCMEHANGIGMRMGEDFPGSPLPPSLPNVNSYQQKKNLAQGMLDLALLSANANQLRYVLESTNTHPYYYFSIALISLSIILQVAVGVGLIMNSRYDVNEHKDIHKADEINNITVLGVFLVTVVNVFITSFSVGNPSTVSVLPPTNVTPIG